MTEYYTEHFCDEYAIKKENKIIAIVDSGSNANKICDELNALHEENQQLEQSIKDLAKELQENVEFDRKQGITQYPTHIVFYMINKVKELLE